MPSPPERRRFARVPVALAVRFRGTEDFHEFVHARIRNLSRGGMFIRSLQSKPLGSEILIQIPDETGGFHTIRGIVRSVIAPREEEHQEPGMGIEFVHVDDKMAQILDDVIARHRL
jgi:uncharacterized protein (TIGR02266 family)